MQAGVRTIDKNYAICKKAVTDALSTNRNYNKDDIDFAGNIVCTGADDRANLINFLHHTYLLSATGRFSFLYNDVVYSTILKRNGQGLINLVNISPESMFPELFSNTLLTDQERAVIKETSDREYRAIYDALAESYNRNDVTNILYTALPCKNQNLDLSEGNLYEQCYANVCKQTIRGDQSKTCDISVLSGSCDIPTNINVLLGIDPEIELPTVQCMSYMTLIKLLSTDGSLDGTLLANINNNNLILLKKRYDKEIKMYKYYVAESKKLN